MGKTRDGVWDCFDKVMLGHRSRARCKKCRKELEGIVGRMKAHVASCCASGPEATEATTSSGARAPNSSSSTDAGCDDIQIASTSTSQVPSATGTTTNPLKRRRPNTMDNYVYKTTVEQRAAIDKQIARYIYATNSPFQCVEHEEFKRLFELTAPGYQPPSRKDVGGKLLDEVHVEMEHQCVSILEGQTVCMAIDGWSNIHNQPIVCAAITDENGGVFITDTVDTSGQPHTSDYLTSVAKNCIKKVEEKFKCSVGMYQNYFRKFDNVFIYLLLITCTSVFIRSRSSSINQSNIIYFKYFFQEASSQIMRPTWLRCDASCENPKTVLALSHWAV